MIICALVTLLALTNRILVVCYVKLLEKHDLCCAFFQTCFMFDTGIFLFVVFTIILTRLMLELPMKVVVSCVKLGVGADIL